MFRCLLRAHSLKELTDLRREHTDMALQRLCNFTWILMSAGRGGATLPFRLSVQLPIAELCNAALGLRDAWNHDVLLRTIHRCVSNARLGCGSILRCCRGMHIVEIAEWITEFGSRAIRRCSP